MKGKLYINTDKNKQNQTKGFTLIELLAVIVIITLIGAICTYSIVNMINNSKKETLAMTEDNIKKTAATYTKEKEGIVWIQDPTSENTLLSCINIQELINEGYFKEEILNNEIIKTKNIEYIIIKKDAQSLDITGEYFDNSGICQKTFNYVTTPSCNNNLTYNGKEQKLIDETSNNNLTFTNNTQTNAGKHQVNLTPKEGYVWENGTNSTINKTCNIQKAKINIKLEPNSAIGQDTTTYTTIATPFIVNNNELITTGDIVIKSSNEQNATASPNTINNVNTNTQNPITINANSTRNSDTIITITFNPIDTKNYESGTNTFTLGDSNTSNIYQITLNPNGGNLGNNPNKFFAIKGRKYGTNLDATPTRTGYTFSGWYTEKEGGTKVTSKSTFNYDKNITLYARWVVHTVTIKYNINNGTLKSNNKSYSVKNNIIQYNNKNFEQKIEYGTTDDLANYNNTDAINIKKDGYHILEGKEWCTEKNGQGTCYNQDKEYGSKAFCENITNNNCSITLYANWILNTVTIKYNIDGGTLKSNNNNYSVKNNIIQYNNKNFEQKIEYGTTDDLANYNNTDAINIKKDDYHVLEGEEWCTEKNGQGTCYNQDKEYGSKEFCENITNNNCSITLYANWKKDIKVKILNSDYMICPNDQNKPSHSDCLRTNAYNYLKVDDVKTDQNNTVSMKLKLHMNNFSTSWTGSNSQRKLCLAKTSSKECVKTFWSRNINSPNWAYPGKVIFNDTVTFNISNLEPGTYSIIVWGPSSSNTFRFKTTKYALPTIELY